MIPKLDINSTYKDCDQSILQLFIYQRIAFKANSLPLPWVQKELTPPTRIYINNNKRIMSIIL